MNRWVYSGFQSFGNLIRFKQFDHYSRLNHNEHCVQWEFTSLTVEETFQFLNFSCVKGEFKRMPFAFTSAKFRLLSLVFVLPSSTDSVEDSNTDGPISNSTLATEGKYLNLYDKTGENIWLERVWGEGWGVYVRGDKEGKTCNWLWGP